MARLITPLTDNKCNSAKPKEKDYKLFDGGGLFLLIKKTGTKSWRMKFNKLDGRETVTAFGNYPTISLKEAREKREKVRELLSKGIDPIEQKVKDKAILTSGNLFEVVARSWIKQTEQEKNWKPISTNKTTRAIEMYLFPYLGAKPIENLTLKDLIKPIQKVIDEGNLSVASRLRQHIIAIMRHAIFKGLIDTNPAVDLIGLKIAPKNTHRAALPLECLGELIKRLNNYQGQMVTKIALLINLQLFIRSSELRFARWSEIDLHNRLWTVPAERTSIDGVKNSDRGAKMMTPHLVPLSNQTITLLEQLKSITGEYELVFSYDGKKPLSENAINQALKRMGYNTSKDICGHGFRTMACSALIESGQFSKDAIERQMSHQERNGVRAAYIHKAEHLDERIRMMQWWSDYLDHVKDNGYIAPYQFKNIN